MPAATATPDTTSAYFHYMMAHEYEEMATTLGRSEYATRAIEEYKMALNADPLEDLNSHLAELYFRTGRIKEAVVAAQDRIKQDPNDLERTGCWRTSICARWAITSSRKYRHRC